MQRPCCRSTLGQVQKQTGGTEGGEQGRDKSTEVAAVPGWLCNWPRGCGLEGAWLFLKWEVWRGDGGNSAETLKSRELQKMDVPKDCHIEECETEKQKYYNIFYMRTLKRHDTDDLIYETETD